MASDDAPSVQHKFGNLYVFHVMVMPHSRWQAKVLHSLLEKAHNGLSVVTKTFQIHNGVTLAINAAMGHLSQSHQFVITINVPIKMMTDIRKNCVDYFAF